MNFTDSLKNEYEALFNAVKIGKNINVLDTYYVHPIIKNKERYKVVEAETGVPWWFIACIHARESSLSFSRHLHNGDPLSSRTRNVPAGRPLNPPKNGFSYSWEESAIDALKYMKLHTKKFDSLGYVLFELERYNGFGYRNRGINSPYLWSFTQQYEKGKYIADGKFSYSAVDAQPGVAAIMRRLFDNGVKFLDSTSPSHTSYWAEVYNDGEVYLWGEPDGVLVRFWKTERKTTSIIKALEACKEFGAGTVAFAPHDKVRPNVAADNEESAPFVPPNLTRVLSVGSQGEDVQAYQKRLKNLGYALSLDGDFGEQTERVTRLFQAANNLNVDGEVGPVTWAAVWSSKAVFKEEIVSSDDVGKRVAKVALAEASAIITEENKLHKKYMQKFQKVFPGYSWPWCAAFVTWCIEEATGKQLPVYAPGDPAKYTFALAEAWQRWAKRYGYWEDRPGYVPQPGDLVLFDWGGATFPDADFEDHIGVFISMDNGAYICAEGNVKNATAVKKRYSNVIQGFVKTSKAFG